MSLKEETRTMVFYESPFRLVKLLEEFKEYLSGDRQVSVSRELSKMFEENARGTLAELVAHFSAKTVKGEISPRTQNNVERLELMLYSRKLQVCLRYISLCSI